MDWRETWASVPSLLHVDSEQSPHLSKLVSWVLKLDPQPLLSLPNRVIVRTRCNGVPETTVNCEVVAVHWGQVQRCDVTVPTRGRGRAGRALLDWALWTGRTTFVLEPGLVQKRGTQGLKCIMMRSQAPFCSCFYPYSNDVWAISECQ